MMLNIHDTGNDTTAGREGELTAHVEESRIKNEERGKSLKILERLRTTEPPRLPSCCCCRPPDETTKRESPHTHAQYATYPAAF